MSIASAAPKKAYKSLPMEGMTASWYAKITANSAQEFEADAARIAERLKPGAHVLELAPGPGYLAIALAKRGAFNVTGLDISRAFVRIATKNAAAAGLQAQFRHGDAAHIPYPVDTFDFIVCRAAYKNFSDPLGAMREIRRVLKPGGEALIIDMNRNVSDRTIDEAVKAMKLGAIDALMTSLVFKYSLRNRAYTKADFERMATTAGFDGAEIKAESIGLDVWLKK